MPATQTIPDLTVRHDCGRTWQLVLTTHRAHTIAQDPATGLWSYAGETAAAIQHTDLGEVLWTWAWSCPCGVSAVLELPAYDRRPCVHPTCDKATTNETLGYTRSGRTGGSWMACPCCGHQGTHLVYRDSTLPRPSCYTTA